MKKISLVLGLLGAIQSLYIGVLALSDYKISFHMGGLFELPSLVYGILGIAGGSAGFTGCALLKKHDTAAAVLMISGGLMSLFSLSSAFVSFLLLVGAGVCVFLQKAVQEKNKIVCDK